MIGRRLIRPVRCVMRLVLGRDAVVALFLGSLLACIPAIVLLVAKGAKARKIGLPFAPFLAGGAVLALFWGEPLLDWWIS